MKWWQRIKKWGKRRSSHDPIYHRLHDPLSLLAGSRSLKRMHKRPLYRVYQDEFSKILESLIVENYGPKRHTQKNFYRVCAWNIQRGYRWYDLISVFQTHPLLKQSDVLLLTELDIGMARTQNRDIPREIAKALKLNYVFAPAYLYLGKGVGLDKHHTDENKWGLHGNAIFSRYPIEEVYAVDLPPSKDEIKGGEHRYGYKRAIIADIRLGAHKVRHVCVHLDVHAGRRHRYQQMKTILDHLNHMQIEEGWQVPTIIGGDWNTITYSARNAWEAFFTAFWRIFKGIQWNIHEHHAYPERHFESKLFHALEQAGFDYKNWNEMGVLTQLANFNAQRYRAELGEWLPNWMFPLINRYLKQLEGDCGFKLDWLCGRGLIPLKVGIEEGAHAPLVCRVRDERQEPYSDHDPIIADFYPPALELREPDKIKSSRFALLRRSN